MGCRTPFAVTSQPCFAKTYCHTKENVSEVEFVVFWRHDEREAWLACKTLPVTATPYSKSAGNPAQTKLNVLGEHLQHSEPEGHKLDRNTLTKQGHVLKLDVQYDTGTRPISTTGLPRTSRVGIPPILVLSGSAR